MGVYTLPDMPYDYGALEPAMSGEILELHHSKHHAAYVKGSNDSLDQLAEARDRGDYTALVGLEKTLAFNLSGHVLHSIFWNNLSPDGGDRPDGELAAAITEHFGSFDNFATQLSTATKLVQGSGWGVLAWEPLGQRLIVEQIYDHHGNVGQGSTPILVFDAREHAYYLQYRTECRMPTADSTRPCIAPWTTGSCSRYSGRSGMPTPWWPSMSAGPDRHQRSSPNGTKTSLVR